MTTSALDGIPGQLFEARERLARAEAMAVTDVSNAIQSGSSKAVNYFIAQKYVEAFGNLAREGTAVVVPGNVGDIGGMIASAMAVYGKVNEGQKKLLHSVMTQESGRANKEDPRHQQKPEAMM